MIADVIDRARREPLYTVPGTKMTLTCRVVDRIAWDKDEIEAELGLRLPEELVALWRICSEVHVYEDALSGQWGLVVPSPARVLVKNREYREDREDDLLPGDLVFAEFRGDLDLAIFRVDRNADDYGSIVVARDIGPRDEWHVAGRTIEEFLARFMNTHGAMYWEPESKAHHSIFD